MRRFLILACLWISIAGCAKGRPADVAEAAYETLPKYGDPDYQTIWSRASGAERESLTTFSPGAASRGWSYLQRGDLETAMKRFNQSWSLDPTNASALWGMAIVQYEKSRRDEEANGARWDRKYLDQSVRLIEEAAALPSPEPSLLNDHAMILITRGASRQPNLPDSATADFDRAEDLLRRAEAFGPHPLIYENWASLERHRGREESSARFAEKAREMRARKSGS